MAGFGERWLKDGECYMSKIRSSLVVLLVGMGLANGVQAQMLASGDEVRAVFADKTAYITHSNGATQKAYFDASGTARVTQKSGVKTGTWSIDKNTICHDLSTEKKCYTLTKKSADTFQLQSTDLKWTPTYKMIPGNPEKL